jgi:hypothetical protein
MSRARRCFRFFLFLTALIGISNVYAFSPENTKFKGDLRLRYQYEYTEKIEEALQRHRGRFRLRFGFATMMRDDLELGARLATGDTDPRSTNQTTTSYFSSKEIRLDKAYVFWSATQHLKLMFGKYAGAFLIVDDMLWDSDITFEGGSIAWKRPVGGGTSPFLNCGSFVLDEDKATGKDPHMYYAQPGLTYDSDGFAVDTGIAFYIFEHLKGSSPDDDISSGTNTLVDGKLKYDYDSVNPAAILIFHPGGTDGLLPAVKLMGDYIYNFDSKDSGYRVGLSLGHLKVKEAGSWQIYYNYRHLERDAFPDVFPDSDFYGGATNVAGHEIIAQYGIVKNVYAGLDYYNARRIEGEREPQNLLQVDCGFKF